MAVLPLPITSDKRNWNAGGDISDVCWGEVGDAESGTRSSEQIRRRMGPPRPAPENNCDVPMYAEYSSRQRSGLGRHSGAPP